MKKTFLIVFGLFLICVLCFLYFSHPFILKRIGRFLVLSNEVEKADCIVVISGGYGNRISAAVRLFMEGRSDWLVVTGPPIMRDYFFDGYRPCNSSWTDLMRAYALDHGIPESQIFSIKSDAESTKDEAELITKFIESKGWKSAILVTSNYHTKRASSIFSKYAGKRGISIYTFGAKDPIYFPAEWWKYRRCVKVLFYEYSKLIFYKLAY